MGGVRRDLKIAIIGSGISGLALGIRLKSLGFLDVGIYERDDGFERRQQGYGLTMLQGIGALKRLGLGVYERVKTLDTPSRSHYIFDCEGNILCFFGTLFYPQPEPSSSKKDKKFNLHISRQNLRNILLEAYSAAACASEESSDNNDNPLPRSVVYWSKKLVGLQTLNNENPAPEHAPPKYRLEFSGEDNSSYSTVEADLVIGCDGINSSVRKYKYSPLTDHSLRYLGILLVLGITESNHALAQARVFQTVDGSTRLFAMPFASHNEASAHNNIMWQLSYPETDTRAKELAGNKELLKATVLDRCRGWHEPIPSMIESTQLSLLMGIAAYDRDPSPPESLPNSIGITLLGDAAHPMSPFKGQGANQALLDAVSFADSLSTAESPEEAVLKFEAEMLKRVQSKVLLSRERVMIFHQPDILEFAAFTCRSSDLSLLQRLRIRGINSESGDQMENMIMGEMNFINNNHVIES